MLLASEIPVGYANLLRGSETMNGTVEWTTGEDYRSGVLECHAHKCASIFCRHYTTIFNAIKLSKHSSHHLVLSASSYAVRTLDLLHSVNHCFSSQLSLSDVYTQSS